MYVFLVIRMRRLYIKYIGKLADGTAIAYKLGGNDGDKFVGRQLSKDKCWIKAKLAGKPEYLACVGEGFKLTPSRCTLCRHALLAADMLY
jgi:hypothetical protein